MTFEVVSVTWAKECFLQATVLDYAGHENAAVSAVSVSAL